MCSEFQDELQLTKTIMTLLLAGKETTIARIGAAAGVEGETTATVTAATQLHPVEEALGENLSGISTETEIGTALIVMLLKGMKSSETTNMGTSEITSMVTSGTTSIETITIGKVGRGKDNHRTSGIATRGTIQGMVAGHLTGSSRAIATMRRGNFFLDLNFPFSFHSWRLVGS